MPQNTMLEHGEFLQRSTGKPTRGGAALSKHAGTPATDLCALGGPSLAHSPRLFRTTGATPWALWQPQRPLETSTVLTT